MADNKYCSTKFKCGEDLDAALDAALCAGDNAARAEAARAVAEECATRAEEAAKRAEQGGTSGGGSIDPALESRVEELEQQAVDLKEQDAALADRTAELEKRFADMDYGEGPTIKFFKHGIGNMEKGYELTSLDLSWDYDKGEYLVSQKLTGPTLSEAGVELELTNKGRPISGVSINADNQSSFRWTLSATDEKGKDLSQQSPGFTFLNRVFYGMADDPGAITSEFIRSLPHNSGLTSKKGRNFTAEGGGNYIWYCLPTGLGTCTFKSANFPAAFSLHGDDPFLFENALGYKENYYVYRSDERIIESIPIEVS